MPKIKKKGGETDDIQTDALYCIHRAGIVLLRVHPELGCYAGRRGHPDWFDVCRLYAQETSKEVTTEYGSIN